MIRKMFAFALVGASFSISAMASSPDMATDGNQRPDRDDAVVRCTFQGLSKGEVNCRAFAIFDPSNLHKYFTNGDADDRLRVICGDGDNDADDISFNDGIATRKARDADDFGRVVDIELAAPGNHNPLIHIEDWNRKLRVSVNAARLRFERKGIFIDEPGECEITQRRRHVVPGISGEFEEIEVPTLNK